MAEQAQRVELSGSRASHGPAPTVSVVIVTHNEGELLRKTVESFLGAACSPEEIIVVDDQSDDASTDFLQCASPTIKLLRTDRQLGISRARNVGGRTAAGDVLVFSDAHVEVTEDWLPPLLDALGDPTVGEVAPSVGWLDGRPGRGLGFTWGDPSLTMKWLYDEEPHAFDIPFLCGCFVALRRDVFASTGGFDDGMYRWGFEDSELSLRLWLSGYRCQAVPASFIRHHFRTDFHYQVDRSGVLYNALRLATIHLDEPALERVIAHFAVESAFGPAWARLLDSDTWERRDQVATHQCRELRWFLDRFGIGAL